MPGRDRHRGRLVRLRGQVHARRHGARRAGAHPERGRERVRELAVETFVRSGCAGLARVDFFVEGDDVLVNELNTMPGFTPTSVYPKLWAGPACRSQRCATASCGSAWRRALMPKRNPARTREVVYSTSDGDLRKARDPRLKARRAAGGRVKVRREVGGRRGKTVTTVAGVPLDDAGLRELAGRLRSAAESAARSRTASSSCRAIIATSWSRCCAERATTRCSPVAEPALPVVAAPSSRRRRRLRLEATLEKASADRRGGPRAARSSSSSPRRSSPATRAGSTFGAVVGSRTRRGPRVVPALLGVRDRRAGAGRRPARRDRARARRPPRDRRDRARRRHAVLHGAVLRPSTASCSASTAS